MSGLSRFFRPCAPKAPAATATKAEIAPMAKNILSILSRPSCFELRFHRNLRLQQARDGTSGLGIVGRRLESLPVSAGHSRRHVQMHGCDREPGVGLLQLDDSRRSEERRV